MPLRTPHKRALVPIEEVSEADWDAAHFVTGTTLVVDGGRLLKSAGGSRP
jgi:hypothetical protein